MADQKPLDCTTQAAQNFEAAAQQFASAIESEMPEITTRMHEAVRRLGQIGVAVSSDAIEALEVLAQIGVEARAEQIQRLADRVELPVYFDQTIIVPEPAESMQYVRVDLLTVTTLTCYWEYAFDEEPCDLISINERRACPDIACRQAVEFALSEDYSESSEEIFMANLRRLSILAEPNPSDRESDDSPVEASRAPALTPLEAEIDDWLQAAKAEEAPEWLIADLAECVKKPIEEVLEAIGNLERLTRCVKLDDYVRST